MFNFIKDYINENIWFIYWDSDGLLCSFFVYK